jgi:hypothetical protein
MLIGTSMLDNKNTMRYIYNAEMEDICLIKYVIKGNNTNEGSIGKIIDGFKMREGEKVDHDEGEGIHGK